MKKYLSSKYWPIALSSTVIWITTYLMCKTTFHLKGDNLIQEFILLISPLSTILLFIGLTMFVSGKRRKNLIMFVSFIFLFILIANSLFYGFFNDFITLPVLLQSNNAEGGSGLWDCVLGLANFKIILCLIGIALYFIYFTLRRNQLNFEPISGRVKSTFFLSVLILAIFNLGLAEYQRPELLSRSFDRKYLVRFIGLYNYHIYDGIISTKTSAQRALADSSELVNIQNYINANYKEPSKKMFGAAKGKNVIVISMESLQNFTIGSKVNGEEVTPFLNQFAKESYYFNNLYHQTAQGKTCDAEFLVDNSLYPVNRGAVFFTNPNNEFIATPKLLKPLGYNTNVFHANDKSFWNRDVVYKSFGYDKFFDVASYDVTDENSIGWGLKDIDFFNQSLPYLESLPQPFYTKMITLTNHFPFELDEQDRFIQPFNSGDKTVDNYFTTVRYMDEALKKFIEGLKANGLYDNTVIVLYGDHYGISDNHKTAMEQFLGKEITPYEQVQLQRVPLFIHVPGQKTGKTMTNIGGEIDVRPTLLHLLGVDTKNVIEFGKDLLLKDEHAIKILRDGSFITDQYVYTNETVYNRQTGEVVKDVDVSSYITKAKQELEYSDRIIYGDLLRFYDKK